MQSNHCILNTLFLSFLAVGSSFSVVPNNMRTTPSSTSRFASRIDPDSVGPKWTDLPRKVDEIVDLDGLEIGVGRVAMVGFFGLLAVEVVSGHSFPQQIFETLCQ
jgi:hypothetical protein